MRDEYLSRLRREHMADVSYIQNIMSQRVFPWEIYDIISSEHCNGVEVVVRLYWMGKKFSKATRISTEAISYGGPRFIDDMIIRFLVEIREFYMRVGE